MNDKHICRNRNYSPHVKACPACIAQLGKNAMAKKRRDTKKTA